MGRFVDSIIAYRILKMLTTPFEKTAAYNFGIIDARGNELKKMSDLHTTQERDAYTILDRMIYRIKRMIEKIPVDNKKLLTFAAALSLIREHANDTTEPIDIESRYLDRLHEDLTEEIDYINKFISEQQTLTFKQFMEEAPANNASATPGVAGFTPDTLGVKPGKKKTVLRRGLPNVK